MDNVELAPLRSLDDFILGTARFQLPNYKDPVRWNNRIANNLLYYQSNYFLTALLIFLMIGVMHPIQMLIGTFAVGGAFGLFVYASNNQHQLRKMKRHHPGVSLFLILLLGYIVIYFLGSVLIFIFGFALPIAACLIHASLRLRNMKNKVENMKNKISSNIEYIGLKRTPMGIILEALGQEGEAGS